MKKFLAWHEELVFDMMEKLNLGVYSLTWISFIKGVILGIIIMCFVGCTTVNQIPTKKECCTINQSKKWKI